MHSAGWFGDLRRLAQARKSGQLDIAYAKMLDRQKNATSQWEEEAAIHDYARTCELIDADYEADMQRIQDEIKRESASDS